MLTVPKALTIVLLLQPAQDPEDPSFWDFQVCLLGAVGKLLPGPQPAYGQLHLSGLTGAFLQLLLVIAGEVVPAQLSPAVFKFTLLPPHSFGAPVLSDQLWDRYTSPGVRRPGF